MIGDLPIGAPVAFEVAYGWGWLVELLEDCGSEPHLVHPLRCKAAAIDIPASSRLTAPPRTHRSVEPSTKQNSRWPTG